MARSDPGCERVRHGLVWNGRKPERFPEIVVTAKNAADVQAAMKFAAETARRVSPCGGDHRFSGIAVQDRVVIEMSSVSRSGRSSFDPSLSLASGTIDGSIELETCHSGFGWNA